MSTNKNNQHGFTIIEVAVVVPLISLIVISLLAVIMTIITSMSLQAARNSLVYESNDTFSQIEKDVTYAASFLPDTLPSNFNDDGPILAAGATYKSQGTPKGSSTPSPDINTLVMQSYDQMKNPVDPTSTIPVIVSPPPCSNPFAFLANDSLPIAIVYFVKDGNLYRRVIPDNTNPATCGTPLISRACTPAATCIPKDTVLAKGVVDFKVDYYKDEIDTAPINAYDAVPSTAIDQAKSISVNLTIKKKISSKEVSYSSSIRSSLTN